MIPLENTFEMRYWMAREELDELHRKYRFAEVEAEESLLIPPTAREKRKVLIKRIRKMTQMRWDRVPKATRSQLLTLVWNTSQAAKMKEKSPAWLKKQDKRFNAMRVEGVA